MDGLAVNLMTMALPSICRILIGPREVISAFGKRRQTNVTLVGGQFGVWKTSVTLSIYRLYCAIESS